jgi:hypothetical protein
MLFKTYLEKLTLLFVSAIPLLLEFVDGLHGKSVNWPSALASL